MRRSVLYCLILLVTAGFTLFAPKTAEGASFSKGAYIIPMDTTYQDDGMLKAYGLVYELLRNDVHVEWTIKQGKMFGGTDFTASATDFRTGSTINAHDYKGGPWVIPASFKSQAKPIISQWQMSHNNLPVVHEATGSFTADVSRTLVAAPTIAMFADGNQDIARGYIQAAGIPDSTLNYSWPNSSPDMLSPAEVAGPTTTKHDDGKLFGPDGRPRYCQLMSMHWDIKEAQKKPEVVAEVRQFLTYPTHFFAECQAVNAFENNVNGKFLTPNGFNISKDPDKVQFLNTDSPFAQMVGPYEAVGGSEPAYSLPPGDSYKRGGIVMVTKQSTPAGDTDIWMTGYLDGACAPGAQTCEVGGRQIGKVSYLGGHEYDTKLPISQNGKTQGARLFLNSLFEAQCATQSGQPYIGLTKMGPSTTQKATVTYTLQWVNSSLGIAYNGVVTDTLPQGAQFVSATKGGTHKNGKVTWKVGSIPGQSTGQVQVTVKFNQTGTYTNDANMDWKIGLNSASTTSNTVQTVYSIDADGDGVPDSSDNCVQTANKSQTDTDMDGKGDACDSDDDGDGVDDGPDNCRTVANAGQDDFDGDGKGDACDADDDDDGVDDGMDNCPMTANMKQTDSDGDGQGDACDSDDDDDGVADGMDNCRMVANPQQTDTDGDGKGDKCDGDLDGDGVDDGSDNCPAVANPMQADADGDGKGDACDEDADGDRWKDSNDNCPMVPNARQIDTDGDGKGDKCDNDDDGDGIPDSVEKKHGLDPKSKDSDQDGIGDGEEFGDGMQPRDTDGDGTPDALDHDSDGDGKTDAQEKGDGDGSPKDSDGDGIPDYRDETDNGGSSGDAGMGGDAGMDAGGTDGGGTGGTGTDAASTDGGGTGGTGDATGGGSGTGSGGSADDAMSSDGGGGGSQTGGAASEGCGCGQTPGDSLPVAPGLLAGLVVAGLVRRRRR